VLRLAINPAERPDLLRVDSLHEKGAVRHLARLDGLRGYVGRARASVDARSVPLWP
jgi:hypothetical protein